MSGAVDVLAVILNPVWWLRNHGTSAELTDYIGSQLDAGECPEILDRYTMRLGKVVLWRENYPYAYGSLWVPCVPDVLPSRAVARRLRKAELAATPPPKTPQDRVRSALARVQGGSA